MTASEAWEVVKAGLPMDLNCDDWRVVRYDHACAIVAGCVKEHEAFKIDCDVLGGTLSFSADHFSAYEAVRALERGEAQP